MMDELERAQKLTEMRRWYLGEIRRDLAVFRDLLARASAAKESSDRDRLDEMRRFAHNWRGSGGTFGFHAFSDAAGQLESALDGPASVEEIAARFEHALLVHAALCSDLGER